MPRSLVAGQFLWGTFQDAEGAVGTQLRALGRSPGDRERPQVPQGDPSALLPLPGLHAEPRRGNDHEMLFGIEDVLMEGILVGCWGLSQSLCSSR